MKKNALFFAILLLLTGCNLSSKSQNTFSISEIDSKNYENFGGKVSSKNIHNINSIAEQYETLKEGDTVVLTFSSTVNTVCKAKGCWMKVTLGDDKEAMVKFKEYSFFVPKDIENDTVIVQGKAYVSEISVSEQRHFATDAGKTDKEIASITVPKKTYSFIADGVLIKN